MQKEILVQRYGHGLIDALRGESEFQSVLDELKDMAGLFFAAGPLGDFLASPFVVKSKKVQALSDILSRAALNPKTMRFLLLLLDRGRLELLPEIIALLPEVWNESRGVLTARVTSAVPLSEAQRRRLAERLEQLEGRPVSLAFSLDPALIGGLTVAVDHQVYDVSVRGRADKLKEIITEG
jgi:F-type H+-transporting ATPase subunit delta